MIAFPPAGEPGETLSTAKAGLAMNHDIMVDLSGIVKNLPIPPLEVVPLGKREDLTGQVFGRLTVVSPASNYRWLCICECGNQNTVQASHLRAGTTRSCGGCVATGNTIHGLYGSPLHTTWKNVLSRCNNPKNISYPYYGGRGITVDSRWLKFENFYEDMRSGYQEGLSIDRIDNSQGYNAENCRWATPKEQARNQRSNRTITYNGETRILIEWCELLKLDYRAIRTRLHRGWTVEQAFELHYGESPRKPKTTT